MVGSKSSPTYEYYMLYPRTDYPATVCPVWLEEYQRTHCFSCGHLDEEYFSTSVPITHKGQKADLQFTHRLPYSMISQELIDALSPEILSACDFGEVTMNGKALTDYRTYRPQHRVWDRGNMTSMCERCPVCRRLAHWCCDNVHYILRRELPTSPIFGDRNRHLIVSREIRERLRSRIWRQVGMSPTPVKEEPIDGFPLDLDTITPDQERFPPRRRFPR